MAIDGANCNVSLKKGFHVGSGEKSHPKPKHNGQMKINAKKRSKYARSMVSVELKKGKN